jgi:hypothetical protein
MTDLFVAEWRTSSRSSSQGQCVEVATNLPGVVAVQDSKHRGPTLVVSQEQWTRFVATVCQ